MSDWDPNDPSHKNLRALHGKLVFPDDVEATASEMLLYFTAPVNVRKLLQHLYENMPDYAMKPEDLQDLRAFFRVLKE